MKSKLTLEKKIQSMEICITRIKKVKNSTKEEFLTNLDLQDVITLNLQRLIQLGIDIACILISNQNLLIPERMADVFLLLNRLEIIDSDLAFKLAKSVGLRNLAVHEYSNLDLDLLYEFAYTEIQDYTIFMLAILKLINSDLEDIKNT
ncbi:MAG: DUF86 domain-containing protein [Leptospira sp.]|nr:DUF86 domain-containing protein [Leptospira sp.]